MDSLHYVGSSMHLPSQDGATALMMASHNGHPSVVRVLLQAGATINTTAPVRYRLFYAGYQDFVWQVHYHTVQQHHCVQCMKTENLFLVYGIVCKNVYKIKIFYYGICKHCMPAKSFYALAIQPAFISVQSLDHYRGGHTLSGVKTCLSNDDLPYTYPCTCTRTPYMHMHAHSHACMYARTHIRTHAHAQCLVRGDCPLHCSTGET